MGSKNKRKGGEKKKRKNLFPSPSEKQTGGEKEEEKSRMVEEGGKRVRPSSLLSLFDAKQGLEKGKEEKDGQKKRKREERKYSII